MRKLAKLPKPSVLEQNETQWLSEYLADLENGTKKYRYRHPEIKATLKLETAEKCVYCESKIGHNTPGDVEHKVPSSKNRALHFEWQNLTIACTECNRRKNAFYEAVNGFLDPYVDDVEQLLEHVGPVVTARVGNSRAEVVVSILKLCSEERMSLVRQKIQKITELQHILERYNSTAPGALREVLRRQLADMASVGAEYSAMVRCALQAKGYAELVK